MIRAILVNGVPASGKSTVARAISAAGGWPLLTLDTIKETFFAHLGTGDREYNRLLGRASYQTLFALAAEFPAGSTAVMDAWFGFQPEEVLHRHLAAAAIADVRQVWCTAPPAEIARRYEARIGQRSAGHLGLDYVPELLDLAGRAKPLSGFPTLEIDSTEAFDIARAMAWLGFTCPPSS